MKKVLEGELTSLAHSILKSKSDNVHELKEKAGLLYEKLCVLSFAEKHFGGKQPNIGKAAFKSAFEIDLDEVITPEKPAEITNKKDLKPEPPVEEEVTSTENTEEVKATEDEEKPVSEKAVSEEASTTQEEVKTTTEEASAAIETSTENETISEEEDVQEKENQGLTEEDFGVHFDELPDFEPATPANQPKKESSDDTKPTEQEEVHLDFETTPEVNDEAEFATDQNTEDSSTNEEEKPKRTMDLFSQEKKSLNDQLKTELKIGLNDRLAFTSKLFDGNVEAYNRVIAKLNDFSSFQEAKSYLMSDVKPNFPWHEHEAVEQRFLEILEAKLG